MPEVPPVTSATLPENVPLFIVFLSLICVTCEVIGRDGKIRCLDFSLPIQHHWPRTMW
jgi:hypothetical protein